MDKNKISAEINEQLPFLKTKYHVKKLGIFGSVVSGEAREDSDIDMLVEFRSPVGFFDFIRLENYLTKTLGRKVDLVTKNALKQAVKEDILSGVVYV